MSSATSQLLSIKAVKILGDDKFEPYNKLTYRKQASTWYRTHHKTAIEFITNKIVPICDSNAYLYGNINYTDNTMLAFICIPSKYSIHLPTPINVIENRGTGGYFIVIKIDITTYYCLDFTTDDYHTYFDGNEALDGDETINDIDEYDDADEEDDADVDADDDDDDEDEDADEDDEDDDEEDDEADDAVDEVEDELEAETVGSVKSSTIQGDDKETVDEEGEEQEDLISADEDEASVHDESLDDGGGALAELEDADSWNDFEDEGYQPKTKKNVKVSTNKTKGAFDINILDEILLPDNQGQYGYDTHPTRQKTLDILKKLKLHHMIIKKIEHSIYNYSIDKCIKKLVIPMWSNQEFVGTYISKAMNIYSNLDPTCYVKNINLYDKVKSGEINPIDLAFIDTHKLFPERWQDILDEKIKREEIIKNSLIEAATDLFYCIRCGNRKTTYVQVQTRSADEPMTCFITCVVCGRKWKK